MGRKKGKLSEKELKELERVRKEEAENQRLIENERLRNELKKEERENLVRKAMLDFTSKHFGKIEEIMKQNRKSENDERLWRKYLDSEATPDPSSPQNLRSLLYQWELSDTEEAKVQTNPRLFLDERSILTQDADIPDRRLKQFQEKRPSIGEKYLKRIKQILTINCELTNFIESEGSQLKDKVYNDLKGLQVMFRKTLVKYLDRWSYEVLTDINLNMISLDPITAEYNYKSDVIRQSLWTFCDVPLPPNYSQVNFIKLNACGGEFTKSNSTDLAQVTFRSFLMKYDHFSDFCSTFKISVNIPDTSDLKRELQNKRTLMLELIDKKLNEMRRERQAFEEEKQRLAVLEAETKKGAKQSQNQKKDVKEKGKTKKKKSPKTLELDFEPPIADENTLVDVSDELQQVLKEKFLKEKEKLDPIYLELETNEINLREMMVLGGVYSFHLLERPQQPRILNEDRSITLSMSSFSRKNNLKKKNTLVTVRESDELQYSEFFYDYKEAPRPRLSLMHLKDDRRQSIFPRNIDVHENPEHRRTTLYIQERRTTAQILDFEEEEKRWVSENEINQKNLFEVQVKIPDDVYWWEPPSVCRWEPWEESDAFKQLSPAMQSYNLNYEKVMEERQRKLFSAPPIKRNFKSIKKLQDTMLSQLKEIMPSHYLITEYLLPRMIDDYKFAEEIRDDGEKEVKQKELRLKLRKEAIERERAKFAEELERKNIENSSKVLPRESKAISFAEPQRILKFNDAETQTEFDFDSKELRKNKKRSSSNEEKLQPKRVSQLKQSKGDLDKSSDSENVSIDSKKSSVTDSIVKDSKIVEDVTDSNQKSKESISENSNSHKVSISCQTEILSNSSSRKSSRRSSNRNSKASLTLSKSLSVTSNKISSVSLKPKVRISGDEGSSEESKESSQSPLIIQARSSFIPSFVQVTPENNPPRWLFNKRKRLKLLEIVKDIKEQGSLQSIQLHDILPTIEGGFDEDCATLSEFLAYLEELQEKQKPVFHSDSYIKHVMDQIAARKAENMAEETAKKLKELQRQLRISKLLEAKQRESTFYRVPRKSIAEVTKSKVWRESTVEQRKRRTSRHSSSLSSSPEKSLSIVTPNQINDARQRLRRSESIIEEPLLLISHFPGKWTKKHVHCESFDSTKNTITFKAGVFGYFGLFTSKYVNFPFKNWKIAPNDDKDFVILTVEVKYTTVEFKISSKGYKVGLHLRTKSFMTELVPNISEFVSFQKLSEKLKAINVNVFPEADACYYIPNISEKFAALENHCNKSIAMFCLTHAFKSCHWNQYSDYRTIILTSKCLIEKSSTKNKYKEVLVTPLKSEFVHVGQKCSEDVCNIELTFTQNPPHQDFNADLYHLLMGEILWSKGVFNETNQMLQWNVFELLSAIKIFSFTH